MLLLYTDITVAQTSLPFLPPHSGCFLLGIPSSFKKSLNTFNAPGPGNSKTNPELTKSYHVAPRPPRCSLETELHSQCLPLPPPKPINTPSSPHLLLAQFCYLCTLITAQATVPAIFTEVRAGLWRHTFSFTLVPSVPISELL